MDNTLKHKETPLVNHMGLRTVLSWRPQENGRSLYDRRQLDPWIHWKNARLAAYERARPVHVLLVFAHLALLALVARRSPPWVMAALGVGLIVTCVELTSYYYAFLIGTALLVAHREQVGRWLLALTAFTQFVAWAPLKGMSTWSDEQHVAMSAATVVAVLIVSGLCRSQPHDEVAVR